MQLQFQSSTDFFEMRNEELAFRKWVLRRDVLEFGSRVCRRVITGRPREDNPAKVGMQGFVSKDDNRHKVDAFLSAAGCEGLSAADFAAAADTDYGTHTNLAHTSTDAVLERDAEELIQCGAVKLLKDTLPLACMLVENFLLVKQHLFA